ncbi:MULTISPECIES: ParA family protein [Pediococcus]|uniref:ParA family protein n=1 Tax=Pediococcus TaxID=1253 RepID=UPI000A4EDEC2|nr:MULTISPECIES: ParA family protein [Pediococcus]
MKDIFLNNLLNRKKGLVITVGNYKGGAGKTSNSILIAYQLSKLGVSTLVVDLDPQTNATKALLLTKSANDPDNINTVDKTIMYGVASKDFRDLPVKILSNLYLLPSFTDFQDFPKYVYQHANTTYDEALILRPLIEPLKDTFDVILLDVPPMSKEVTENAVVASDYTLISFQTQERSLTGAENYISDLLKYKDAYMLDIDILGILPVLQNKNGSVDKAMLDAAKSAFGWDLIFKTVIPHMERIKRFDITGITDRDRFDKKVMEKYKSVTGELIQRIYESEND